MSAAAPTDSHSNQGLDSVPRPRLRSVRYGRPALLTGDRSTSRGGDALCALLIFSLFACGSCTSEHRSRREALGVGTAQKVTWVQGAQHRVRRFRVLFLGTSLTAGFRLPRSEAYPAQIQAKIDSAGLPFRVVNAGIDGLTTRGALCRIRSWLDGHLAVVVLELGANDALGGVAPKELRRNLQAVIDTVRKVQPAAPIVLEGLKAPQRLHIEDAIQYEAVFEELSKRNDIALVPSLLDGVLENPQLMQADGLHPNAKGEAIVGRHVWSVIKGILWTQASRVRGESAAYQRQPAPY